MVAADPAARISITPVDPEASVLDHALSYGRDGFLVVFTYAPIFGKEREPSEEFTEATHCSCNNNDCSSIGKHPIGTAWQKRSSHIESKIRDEYQRHKRPNVGIQLGKQPNGYFIVAIDVDDEPRLAQLVSELGELPSTVRCDSGRGYRLFYLLPPEVTGDMVQNTSKIGGAPGVDAKADNGQVVVAPSWHFSGKRYRWTQTGSISVLPLPWALKLVRHVVPKWFEKYTPQSIRDNEKAKRKSIRYLEVAVTGQAAAIAACGPGMRNNLLYESAVSLFALCAGMYLGAQWPYVHSELSRAAKSCGLTEREIRKTIDSAESFVRGSGASRAPPVLMPDPPKTDPSSKTVSVAISDDTLDAIRLQIDHGSPAKTAENVAILLTTHPVWRGGPRIDTYSQTEIWPDPLPDPISTIHRAEREIVDADHSAVQGWIMSLPNDYRVRVGPNIIKDGIHLASSRNRIDLLRQWIDFLPPWDNVSRVSTWTSRYLGCEDTAYSRTTGKAWLVATLERALKPGVLIDTAPILEGKQRSGKNRALEILFAGGPNWAPWVVSINGLDLEKTETLRLACSRWILLDDELRSSDPRRVESLKSWASRTYETYRLPYGREISVNKRRGALVTATNREIYLHDDTGNRRWWPWRTTRIDLDGLAQDRLQLLAEAKIYAAVRREAGLAWQVGLDDEFYKNALDESERRRVRDPLVEQLEKLLRTGSFGGCPCPALLTTQALASTLGYSIDKIDKSLETKMGAAMRELGYTTSRPGAQALKDMGYIHSGNSETRVRIYVPSSDQDGPKKVVE